MVNDYLTGIISVSIGVIVATIGNYIYYLKTTHTENKINFLKEQITDLLLPLFILFQRIESENMATFTMESFPDNLREDKETFVNFLIEDNEIEKIVYNKLYLASPKLSFLLLRFINHQYAYSNDEMDKIEESKYILEKYIELKETIYNEYKEKITLYENYFCS